MQRTVLPRKLLGSDHEHSDVLGENKIGELRGGVNREPIRESQP